MKVYPIDFLNPLNADTQQLKLTKNSYMIHQYTASWIDDDAKKKQKLKKYIPNLLLNERVIRIAKKDIKKIMLELGMNEL